MGGYELTLELHGARLEIEADDVDELEAKLGALDVARLEALIAEKRIAIAPTVAPPGTAKGTKRGAKKSARSKKASKKTTKK